MAWPSDLTWDINNVSALVWREILPEQMNLITSGDYKIFQVASQYGAIEPWTGGDKFIVHGMINTGMTEVEYDPAASDSGATLGTTGYQYLAPAEYKFFGRTKNIIFPQDLQAMTNSPRQVRDIFQVMYLANIMGILDNLANNSATPGGFFYTTGVLPANGITNAKAMFADVTSNFAGVDITSSAGANFKPTIVDSADPDGSELINSTLQSLLDSCDRGAEGSPNAIITDKALWEKVRTQLIASGILAIPSIGADVGIRDTIPYRGATIHWTRHLGTSTAWDVTNGLTAEHAVLAIDFRSVRFRVQVGAGLPGDDFGFFRRLNEPTLHPTLVKLYQRLSFIGQWCFTRSRRTSGQLEGMNF